MPQCQSRAALANNGTAKAVIATLLDTRNVCVMPMGSLEDIWFHEQPHTTCECVL